MPTFQKRDHKIKLTKIKERKKLKRKKKEIGAGEGGPYTNLIGKNFWGLNPSSLSILLKNIPSIIASKMKVVKFFI